MSRSAWSGPLLALISTVVAVSTLEWLCRAVNVDFEFKAHAYNTLPIFFRPPTVPVGTAFFRHAGPARWEGKVLDQYYRMMGGRDGRYRDEPAVSITYDALGFRNPDDLADWDIVVVGDSFTELGYLPYEDLFTTRVGTILGLRVKNLGVSGTGPFTHVAYLAEYGKAASTRDALLVFFEGNDFIDMVHEHERMEAAASAGGRHPSVIELPSRLTELPPQRSFLTAVYRLLTGRRPEEAVGLHPMAAQTNPESFNAYFVYWNGSTTPVQFELVAPSADRLTPLQRQLTNEAIHDWATTARRLGLRPWLVFMPCKRRVLDGFFTWKDGASRVPLPRGIPQLVHSVAAANRVGFIDVSPQLEEETRAGHLTYNAVGDSHLNRLGSLVVARVIADALRR